MSDKAPIRSLIENLGAAQELGDINTLLRQSKAGTLPNPPAASIVGQDYVDNPFRDDLFDGLGLLQIDRLLRQARNTPTPIQPQPDLTPLGLNLELLGDPPTPATPTQNSTPSRGVPVPAPKPQTPSTPSPAAPASTFVEGEVPQPGQDPNSSFDWLTFGMNLLANKSPYLSVAAGEAFGQTKEAMRAAEKDALTREAEAREAEKLAFDKIMKEREMAYREAGRPLEAAKARAYIDDIELRKRIAERQNLPLSARFEEIRNLAQNLGIPSEETDALIRTMLGLEAGVIGSPGRSQLDPLAAEIQKQLIQEQALTAIQNMKLNQAAN